MKYEDLPEDMQENIDALKHWSLTIQESFEDFQLQVSNCMDEIISEAQNVRRVLDLPEDMQENIDALKHWSLTIQESFEDFQLQVSNCMDEIISEAQNVRRVLGTPAHQDDCTCGQCTGEDAAIEAMERGIVEAERARVGD